MQDMGRNGIHLVVSDVAAFFCAPFKSFQVAAGLQQEHQASPSCFKNPF